MKAPEADTIARIIGLSEGVVLSGIRSSDFAIELAQQFAKRFPPGTSVEGALAKTFARAVDDLCMRAQAFQRENKLGFYAKAKFGTEFKHTLKDVGYPDALADELTSILLVRMSAK